jgi:hypothetical protein
MRYVSIDIETSGLDPEKHQVLEVGAVIDDTDDKVTPMESLPRIRVVVLPGTGKGDINGSPFALTLNGELIREICEVGHDPAKARPGTVYVTAGKVGETLRRWLSDSGVEPSPDGIFRITAAGKNFASFDRPFLVKLPGFSGIHFRHRTLDPSVFFLEPGDEAIPDTALCKERAGLDSHVAHQAVEDALDVVALTRCALKHPLFALDRDGVGR